MDAAQRRNKYRSIAQPSAVVDVAIVGAGPVGVFSAALLQRYGLRVIVVEKSLGVYDAPRAVAIDEAATRALGLADPALCTWLANHVNRCPVDIRTAAPLCSDGSTCLPCADWYSYSIVGPLPPEAVPSQGGYLDTSFFHQPSLERRLREAAFTSSGSAQLMEQVTVDGIDVPEAGTSPVVLHCTGAQGERVTVSARVVLGADGGSSTVRRLLGIPFEGDSYPDEPWLVIDVETDDASICSRWQCFNFIANPTRPFVHCPLPCGVRRFEFMLLPGESHEEMLQDGSVTKLLASIGVARSCVRLVRAVVYTFHARCARTWRAGRVALLGDAAHCMPPFRGQGLCSGLLDAANVCWKVATVLSLPSTSGSAVEEGILCSYQSEREGHVKAVTAVTLAMGRLIMLRWWPLVWLRNAVFGAVNATALGRSLLKSPFAPPRAFQQPCLADHHDGQGKRAGSPPGDDSAECRGRCDAWIHRDAVQGAPMFNSVCTWWDTAQRVMRDSTLDEALWHLSKGSKGPCWTLLLGSCYMHQSSPLHSASKQVLARLQSAPIHILFVQVVPWAGSQALLQQGGKGYAAVGDIACTLQHWFDTCSAHAVLLRPDRVVYGAYRHEEVAEALRRLSDVRMVARTRVQYSMPRVKALFSNPHSQQLAALVVLLLTVLWAKLYWLDLDVAGRRAV